MTESRFLRHSPDISRRSDLPATAGHPYSGLTAIPLSSRSSPRQRVTVFLSAPLLERLRNAVYWTERRPLARIIEDAVEDAVAKLEHANGGAFPTRLAPLKPGRPRRARLPAPALPALPIASERT